MAPTSTTKHLKTGDAQPPLQPGVLRLYSMKFCPYADRARLVLHAKGIEHEVVNVNTWKKPTWFVEKNPLQNVPVLERDDKIVYESLIVAKYLEEIYPDKTPLTPKDPYQRARDDLIVDYFASKVAPVIRGTDSEAINKGLAFLNDDLTKRGTGYFFGSRPGLVDYMMWPVFARLRARKGQGAVATHEALDGWVSRMLTDESVQSILHPDSAYLEFVKHYRTDNTLFDEIETPN